MICKNPLKNKKVLITCGPTWIPIDGIRVISNRSTGKLGQTLAQYLAKEGSQVTLLEGPVNESLRSNSIRLVKFQFFDELNVLIKKELKKPCDIFIHAAAVSDYKLKQTHKSKIRSGLKGLQLKLIPTLKIINQIKQLNPEVFLVGFKLESKITKNSAVHKSLHLFKEAKCDLVVANALIKNRYVSYIINRQKHSLGFETSRKNLARRLIHLLKIHL